MTTEQTDHPAHTDHTHPTEGSTEQTQQREQINQKATTVADTTITFNGLMVFRPDLAGKTCDVGVLYTPPNHPQPHVLQIEISPDPSTGTGKLVLDPAKLNKYVTDGHVRWTFEVVQNGKPAPSGIVVDTAIPPNRHTPPTPTPDHPLSFGWLVNLESGEFHSGTVVRTPKKLKPIIQLTKGQLTTSCLTDSVDVKQGPNTRLDFGFIAGAVTLTVKPTDGDMAVLYFTDENQVSTVVFRLPNINQVGYKVFIRNTPIAPPFGGHFHMFYDLLFQGVGANQRFDFQLCYPPSPAPTSRCSESGGPDPDPFKCGGVAVGGSGPLE